MEQVTTIGLDIAKHVFQVHGADAAGHVLFRKRVTRTKLIGFLAAQTPCVVAMEASAGAHYWAREIGKLVPGDVLMVTRLARSTRDLLNTLAAIADRKAGFRSLGDAWADTTTSHGRLMLTVLGGLAEFERDLIRARTAEGRERAKARGVKMGRKPKLTAHQQQEARRRRDSGKETLADIARSFNVSHSTISRLEA